LDLNQLNLVLLLSGDSIKFTVIGYGHGVGLSQNGADSLAKQGMKYEEIIKHYYKNVEIKGSTNIDK